MAQEQVGGVDTYGLPGETQLPICDMCGEYPLLVVHSGIAHGQCLISSITLKQGGCQTASPPSAREQGVVTSPPVHTFIGKILVAIDMLACVLWTRDADITISAMLQVYVDLHVATRLERLLYSFLNWLERGHCEIARLNDIARAQKAIDILTIKNAP